MPFRCDMRFEKEEKMFGKRRIRTLVDRIKTTMAHALPSKPLELLLASLFGSINLATNTYKIAKQSQFSTWLMDQMATGFQHITNSNDNIIKVVRSEEQALLTISHTLFNQTRTIECDLACRSYAQDLFTATKQEILDLCLHKTPRHVLNDLIEILDLHRWFSSEKMKNVRYSELLFTIMMYTGNECAGCLGFFATFPLMHPDQVYPNSTTIRSVGVVVKNQVIKWDHLTGYMTLKGTLVKETLFTSHTCHETHNYVVFTCNTLQLFSPNDSKLIHFQSLHGHSNAIQVSHTQWCTAQILSSSSTRSAQTAYIWWDWMLRGCAIGSALIFSFTLLQCCYFRYLIGSVKSSTNAILTLSPLQLPTLHRLNGHCWNPRKWPTVPKGGKL
uniref:Uncharacterized protein n=1 Tax=Sinocyclocheilus rhinocerous TaxID=307959 RepID=A0A673L7S6_9TELE